jgi:hypothetical protein
VYGGERAGGGRIGRERGGERGRSVRCLQGEMGATDLDVEEVLLKTDREEIERRLEDPAEAREEERIRISSVDGRRRVE